MAPFRPRDGQISDGDILEAVPFLKWKDGEAKPVSARGIVTSHGCACEDYERALGAGKSSKARKVLLRVARMQPASNFPALVLDDIRDGQHTDLFFVDGDETTPDQVVDLTNEQPFPAELLVKLPFRTRISEAQWKRLQMQAMVERLHAKPEEFLKAEIVSGEENLP